MRKKKALKSKAARGVRNLPAKTLGAKQARSVKAGSKSGGGGEGRASFHDLSFVHNVDKSSPVL